MHMRVRIIWNDPGVLAKMLLLWRAQREPVNRKCYQGHMRLDTDASGNTRPGFVCLRLLMGFSSTVRTQKDDEAQVGLCRCLAGSMP